MRTDSTHLSTEALESCRHYIHSNFGKDYLPDNPKIYSSKEGAQEAHEAIRPSDVNVLPKDLKNVEDDAPGCISLWQYLLRVDAPAKYLSTSIAVGCDKYELRTKGRIMQFDGYLKVMPTKEEDVVLPDINVADILVLEDLEPFQNFTKPPPRYTEASLVKELERKGIGRPSTYAAIISTIQDRGYVELRTRDFCP